MVIIGYSPFQSVVQHVAASSGMARGDLDKLKAIISAVPELSYICLDVANGYSEHFVEFVKNARKEFPDHTIMASISLDLGRATTASFCGSSLVPSNLFQPHALSM